MTHCRMLNSRIAVILVYFHKSRDLHYLVDPNTSRETSLGLVAGVECRPGSFVVFRSISYYVHAIVFSFLVHDCHPGARTNSKINSTPGLNGIVALTNLLAIGPIYQLFTNNKRRATDPLFSCSYHSGLYGFKVVTTINCLHLLQSH